MTKLKTAPARTIAGTFYEANDYVLAEGTCPHCASDHLFAADPAFENADGVEETICGTCGKTYNAVFSIA